MDRSGFENRGLATQKTGGNVTGEFTGVTELIEKGQVVQVLNKQLTVMDPSANMGSLDRAWSAPLIVASGSASDPKFWKLGEFSDGSHLLTSCGSTEGPGHMYSSSNEVLRVSRGEVAWQMDPYDKISSHMPSGYGKMVFEPTSGDIYVVTCYSGSDTYRDIAVHKFGKNGEFVGLVGIYDLKSTYCLGSSGNPSEFLAEITGDLKMIILARSGSSSNTLKCYVLDLVTGEVIRDGLYGALPVSYGSGSNQGQYGNKTIWLNEERTKFILPFHVYSYYWDYFLFDTSKGDDPAKYPLAFQELADSSPFASQQRMMTAEMDKFFHDGAASRGFANAEMDRVFLPVVYSTSMTWNCYKVDGDSFATNTENPSTQNNVNSTSLIALWRCNGFFYCLGYSTANSMLYSTAIKESDGTCAWENVIIGSNLNPYYLNSFCVDPVEEMAYLVTADNDSDAYTGQYPSMLSVSFANEKMSMKGMVKAYWPEFTPKGRMKKTISIGDVVIVLQGNYSDGSGFSEFRYHIFDKVQSLWEVETSLTQNIIRANAVSQNYWTLYSYSEYFTSEVIGADIYLYGHGLGHIGTGTDDLKKWQSQTLSLVTGMLLGVAESKQTNGKIQIVLSGNVPLHSDYAKTFKNIDHTTIGGNKATLLGSVAMLPGIGA